MTAKIKASSDGLKVTIGNAAEDALEINQTAKTIKGINGYSIEAQAAPKAGTILQKLVFDGGSISSISSANLINIINTIKTITPKSTNSTLFVEALAQVGGPAPSVGVNLSRFASLYETNTAGIIGGVAAVGAISGAGTGISAFGSVMCQAIIQNNALTPRSFGLGGYVSGAGSASYSTIILSITEIQN